jgi:predicted transcriptional regulator YheO
MSYFECLEVSEDGTDTVFATDSLRDLFDQVIEYYADMIDPYETSHAQAQHNAFYSVLVHDLKAKRDSIGYIEEQLKSEWKVKSPRQKYEDDFMTEMDYTFTLVFRRKNT